VVVSLALLALGAALIAGANRLTVTPRRH